MIERLVERVLHAKRLDDVLIATTTLDQDDRLEELADSLGIGCYRGPVDDVLGRISGAVTESGADVAVEVLGDNPLVHADLIDAVADLRAESDTDYAANVTTEHPNAPPNSARFPVGVRAECYTADTISRAAREAKSPYHRENPTTYVWDHPNRFRLGYLEAAGPWGALHRPDLTFAVNYAQNHEMVAKIYQRLYPKDANFTLHEVIRAFDEDRSLARLMGPPKIEAPERDR